MGTPLSSATVASTYQALLKVSDNSTLSGVDLKVISDGLGNDSPLRMNMYEMTNYGGGQDPQKTANTAFGRGVLVNNTSGTYCVGMGWDALLKNTTGLYNTGMGVFALKENQTGNYNTAIGTVALSVSTGSERATAIGAAAFGNAVNVDDSVAVGYLAGGSMDNGFKNTFIGVQAGLAEQFGSDNTVIGYAASHGGYDGSTVIGYGAAATANSQFVVGSAFRPAGATLTETITPNRTWTVRINGANYKIPMLAL